MSPCVIVVTSYNLSSLIDTPGIGSVSTANIDEDVATRILSPRQHKAFNRRTRPDIPHNLAVVDSKGRNAASDAGRVEDGKGVVRGVLQVIKRLFNPYPTLCLLI